MKNSEILLIYIDLFCGAGGVTSGIEDARILDKKIAKVIACVNHDEKAIESHKANHPDAVHFIEDIRKLDVLKLVAIATQARIDYPNARLALWASVECDNFSKAKGGQPKDADSRTLANDLFPYLKALNPDFFHLENVEEFMSWGPLDENGKPISKKAGADYIKWVNRVKSYGFDFDWRLLNSADFGANTSRVRYFAQFAKYGLPIAWPNPTHSKKPIGEMFGQLKPWNPVREVLDFSDEGESIFNRKKPLVENTLERYYEGLIKFVAGGKNEFLSLYYSGDPKSKNISLDSPARSITTKDHHSLVRCFLSQYYGNGGTCSIDNPATTLTTKDRLSLVTLEHHSSSKFHYLFNPAWGGTVGDIDKPCCVIVARQDKAPLYLLTAVVGNFSIPIYDTDSPMTIKIKEFMALYGIVDIKMRMLRIDEMKQITGFSKNYILVGNQADQKKFIGNAVPPVLPKAICEALGNKLIHYYSNVA